MRPLPERLELDEGHHVLGETLKDGFWSAVGVYAGAGGRVVLKVYRERGWRGVPLGWIGRLFARREAAILGHVEDVEGVPRLRGVHGATGIAHDFLEGRPLQQREEMSAEFFDRLEALVAALHERGVAYSDLSKRDNILVGSDGRPYLFDFQISWCWPPQPGAPRGARLLPGFVGRRVLHMLQEADVHHVLKHRSRHVPGDPAVKEAAARLRQPAWPIRLLRRVSRPYHRARRRRRTRP